MTGVNVHQGEARAPQEVHADILKHDRIGGRNDRYILGMTHLLQHIMPDENIKVIFETLNQIQLGEVG